METTGIGNKELHMTYEPGQVKNIFPYIDFKPGWFILGGPADANEAQVFHERYPEAKILGIEPNKEAFEYQQNAGFPGTLLPYALGPACGVAFFHPNTIRSGWIDKELGSSNYEVEMVTLDSLDQKYGPFQNTVMWLDIDGEDQEIGVLRAATSLHYVKLMNIEVIEDRHGQTTKFDRFVSLLSQRGFRYAGDWNCGVLSAAGRYRRDTIWKAI